MHWGISNAQLQELINLKEKATPGAPNSPFAPIVPPADRTLSAPRRARTTCCPAAPRAERDVSCSATLHSFIPALTGARPPRRWPQCPAYLCGFWRIYCVTDKGAGCLLPKDTPPGHSPAPQHQPAPADQSTNFALVNSLAQQYTPNPGSTSESRYSVFYQVFE